MPALEEDWVQGKLTEFHAKMSSLSFTHCICCNESFPSVKLSSSASVCSRCSRDKQEPKLYSAANNMDPGSVPLALQALFPASLPNFPSTQSWAGPGYKTITSLSENISVSACSGSPRNVLHFLVMICSLLTPTVFNKSNNCSHKYVRYLSNKCLQYRL